MEKLIDLTNDKAKKYFLRPDNYCHIDLPEYFSFTKILKQAEDVLIQKKTLQNCCILDPIRPSKKISISNFENVNYRFYTNKDGNFAWRPFEIIHPLLYLNLVNIITEQNNWNYIKNRFKEFYKNKNIVCCSLAMLDLRQKKSNAPNIIQWWSEFEQGSIKLSLDYNYMANTDIVGCYEHIYTHSISWALHTKSYAKANRSDISLLGNKIDFAIQQMHYGQTNGIPQGSAIMDFIAEIVLGYADEELSKKLKGKIKNYKILRYRDDYRIFSNDREELNEIIKILNEVLIELNFKLNSQKTFITDDIITNSIKPDKLVEIKNIDIINNEGSLQKKLLIIKDIFSQFQNSSRYRTLLTNIYKTHFEKLTTENKKHINKNAYQIIAILGDIWVRNPSAYKHIAAIIGKILSILSFSKKKELITKLKNKFKNVPNNAYFEIWLQRIIAPTIIPNEFTSKMAKFVYGQELSLWDNSWLLPNLLTETALDNTIKEDIIGKPIPYDELKIFENHIS